MIRAWREFLAVPTLVIAGFVVVAGVAVLADQSHAPWLEATRRTVSRVVSPQAGGTVLNAIATGLVTVTSITFSVLLLAVQQTATSLSPVVFDQFLRRRLNQWFLGFFVGLALFAYVVLGAIQRGTPPTIGAAVAILLTVAALLFLVVLVYTTIHQMRPVSVLGAIHDHALRARRREEQVLARTRREAESGLPATVECRAERTGYVAGIDLDRLEASLPQGVPVEVRFRVTIGSFVVVGDVVAEVCDDDGDRARGTAQALRQALSIEAVRDIDRDASAAVDELVNIAWSAISSAKHSPAVGLLALHSLRDVIVRWQEQAGRLPSGEVMPVVYPDTDIDRALEHLFTLLAAAAEAKQPQTTARVLQTYQLLIPRLDPVRVEHLAGHLRAARPALAGQLLVPALDRALVDLVELLDASGCEEAARSLEEVRRQMSPAGRPDGAAAVA